MGIFCGDYSECDIEDNNVSDTAVDHASGDITRGGLAIVSYYGAEAKLDGNEISGSPGGIGAFVDATIEHER